MRIPPSPTVGEGFHARPARVDGKRGCARKNGARAVPAGLDALGGRRHRARRIKRGCNRSRRTAAPNPPRQSSGARGVEDAAPYGSCETYAAACKVTCAVLPRRTKGARAVPAGLDALGGGREAGAPWITWMLSDTPDGCNQPGPAIPRSRGVEDAAPYGRLRNERLSMERNGH